MIVVVGDLLLDVFLLDALRQEEQATGIALRSGGSAANTAAWLGALNADVTFVGCVGDDPIGEMLKNELQLSGVRLSVRTIPGVETGAVAIEIAVNGERAMRSARGANQYLSPGDILRAGALRPDMVHLSGYALLGHHGLDLIQACRELARDCNAAFSFDPSSVGVVKRFGSESLMAALAEARVRILLPNRLEALALTEALTVEAAALALETSDRAVFVKDGSYGAIISSTGQTIRIPADGVIPLDSTGAGDAFNAGVLFCHSSGGSDREACAFAHSCAARVLSQYGGRPPKSIGRSGDSEDGHLARATREGKLEDDDDCD